MANQFDEVFALIPVRAGSSRVENKNIEIVGSSTLMERKIAQLANAGIRKIYVGSDSDRYLTIAQSAGAIPIKRSNSACDENVSSANDMIADFVSRVPEDRGTCVWAHCTNPFLYSQVYIDALERYQVVAREGEYDSLISVTKVQSHMWNSMWRPENYDPYGPRHTLARDLAPVYFQDGGIFIQPIESMRANGYFFGRRPYLYEVDSILGFDINTPADMQMARTLAVQLDVLYAFTGK